MVLSAIVSSTLAHAGGETIFFRPVARFVFSSTDEGKILAERVLGRGLIRSRLDDELRLFEQKLSQPGMEKVAGDVRAQIASIERAALKSATSNSLLDVIPVLARGELQLIDRGARRVRFVPSELNGSYQKARGGFLEGATRSDDAAAMVPAGGRDEALEGIRRNPYTWGYNRNARGINLSGAKMKDVELYNIDFSFATLQKANLSGARTASTATQGEVSFAWAEMRGAKLVDAKLDFVNFAGAKLEKADFTRAKLLTPKMKGANASGARFVETEISVLEAPEASFRGAVFERSKLEMPDFTGADLRGAKFVDTSVYRGNFVRADFRGADLSGLKIERGLFPHSMVEAARFDQAVFDATTKLPFSKQVALKLGMVFQK